MDWTLAISRNRDALLRIIAALYALAGVANGVAFTSLPLPIYRIISSIVHRAESAVRRLIVIAAHGIVLPPAAIKTAPFDFTPKSGASHYAAFPLIDPLKRFAKQAAHEDADADDSEQIENDENIQWLAEFPRTSLPSIFDPDFTLPTKSALEETIDAAHLSRRIAAINRALANLAAQAKRLARWQMRRDLALKANVLKPRRITPFRLGLPPGSRKKPCQEIDHILKECHALAMDRAGSTS